MTASIVKAAAITLGVKRKRDLLLKRGNKLCTFDHQ